MYLKENYFFDEKEIRQHIELFKNAEKQLDLIGFLAEKKRYAQGVKNPKGYIITCLKNEMEHHSVSNEKSQNLPPENDFMTENLIKKSSYEEKN